MDVLPGKIVDYLWDLVRKAASSSPRSNKRCHGTPRGAQTNDTFTPRPVATATMSRGEICLVIILNISMGGMWHMRLMTHVTLVTRLRLSVILMSSVILTNDGCDTPPYTNRNHSHRKPGPFYFQAKVSKSFVGCKNISSHFLGGEHTSKRKWTSTRLCTLNNVLWL